MNIDIQDHSAEVSAEIKAALLRGLEKIGLVAEGYAKNCKYQIRAILGIALLMLWTKMNLRYILGQMLSLRLTLNLARAFTPKAEADGLRRGCIRTQKATGITRAATRHSRF